MALDSREQVFVEIYALPEKSDGRPAPVKAVLTRHDVTKYPDHRRRLAALDLAANTDRSRHGVRIAKYTIQLIESF